MSAVSPASRYGPVDEAALEQTLSRSSVHIFAAKLGTTPGGVENFIEGMVRAALLIQPTNETQLVEFYVSYMDDWIRRNNIQKQSGNTGNLSTPSDEQVTIKDLSTTSVQLDPKLVREFNASLDALLKSKSEGDGLEKLDYFKVRRPQHKWQPRPPKPAKNSQRSLEALNMSRSSLQRPSKEDAELLDVDRRRDNLSRASKPTSGNLSDEQWLKRQMALNSAGLAKIIKRDLPLYRSIGEEHVQRQESVRQRHDMVDVGVQSNYLMDVVIPSKDNIDRVLRPVEKEIAAGEVVEHSNVDLIASTNVEEAFRGDPSAGDLREDIPSSMNFVSELPDLPVNIEMDDRVEDTELVPAVTVSGWTVATPVVKNKSLLKQLEEIYDENLKRNFKEEEPASVERAHPAMTESLGFLEQVQPREMPNASATSQHVTEESPDYDRFSVDEPSDHAMVDFTDKATLVLTAEFQALMKVMELQAAEVLAAMAIAKTEDPEEPASHALVDFSDKATLVLNIDMMRQLEAKKEFADPDAALSTDISLTAVIPNPAGNREEPSVSIGNRITSPYALLRTKSSAEEPSVSLENRIISPHVLLRAESPAEEPSPPSTSDPLQRPLDETLLAESPIPANLEGDRLLIPLSADHSLKRIMLQSKEAISDDRVNDNDLRSFLHDALDSDDPNERFRLVASSLSNRDDEEQTSRDLQADVFEVLWAKAEDDDVTSTSASHQSLTDDVMQP